MDLSFIKQELSKKGYCVVSNVLNETEINRCKHSFQSWLNDIPDHNHIYNGIYKYHNAGHTWHAWFSRTHPNIQKIFKHIWDCNDLIVSFDGCCYIPKECDEKDSFWTHTDQAPNSRGFQCIQSFLSFTENKERTFVVYEGTHKLHETYFKNINSDNNWHVFDEDYIRSLQSFKRILHVKPGDLVLWDSRTYHQNQYGTPNSETRMVQYICFFPKNHPENTKELQKIRRHYYETRRTTTHWPAPIYAIEPKTTENTLMDLCEFKDKIQNII